MRKLVWFTIGFTAACAVGIYCDLDNWLILFSVISLMFFAITFFFSTDKVSYPRLILLGCTFAFLWVWGYNMVYLNPVKYIDKEPQEVTITLCDFMSKTDYGSAGEGKITLQGRTYRVQVYLNGEELLGPGDVLAGEFRLLSTVGDDSPKDHFSSDGVFLIAYEKNNVSRIDGNENDIRYFTARLRQKITKLLDAVFPVDTLPFARALLLGDRSLLDYETNSALSISGIRHVVAVSGLHVSILLGIIFGIFGYRRFITPLIGWGVLLIFAAVTGFTPSVVRACVMYSLMLGSLMLQREYDPPTALSFAVMIMLIVNPVAVSSVSLQLSIGCLVGILLFSDKIRGYLLKKMYIRRNLGKTAVDRIKNGIAASVSISLSTWITTTPFCAVYFGAVSLVGVFTNLLTLWLITVIFCGILVVCVLGAFSLTAGQLGAWLFSWPIRFVLQISKLLAKVPLAAVYTCDPYIVWWLVFAYTLLIVFAFLSKKHTNIMIICIVIGLVSAVVASRTASAMDHWEMSVLDVGQGQCIYLKWGDKHYLVDCGGDSPTIAADNAAEFLISRGILELDGIILTHGDDDHMGGMENLLKRVNVQTIYLPSNIDQQENCKNLILECSDRISWIGVNTVKKLERYPITIISSSFEKSENESSLCVLFQPENYDILITGDRNISGERALISQVALPDLEVLVVGHHGAKSATGMELLSVCLPEIAIISVGKDNRYGHPAPEVLERLAIFNTRVLRTDVNGTISIRG